MTAIELALSIYNQAIAKGKKAWISLNQEKLLFDLLYKEGNTDPLHPDHFIGYILPDGTSKGKGSLTHEEANKIRLTGKIKRVMIKYPPFYIKREGFRTPQIFVYEEN
jgi:hypothetical protein